MSGERFAPEVIMRAVRWRLRFGRRKCAATGERKCATPHIERERVVGEVRHIDVDGPVSHRYSLGIPCDRMRSGLGEQA